MLSIGGTRGQQQLSAAAHSERAAPPPARTCAVEQKLIEIRPSGGARLRRPRGRAQRRIYRVALLNCTAHVTRSVLSAHKMGECLKLS